MCLFSIGNWPIVYKMQQAQVNRKWSGSGSEVECEGSRSAGLLRPAIFFISRLYFYAAVLFLFWYVGVENPNFSIPRITQSIQNYDNVWHACLKMLTIELVHNAEIFLIWHQKSYFSTLSKISKFHEISSKVSITMIVTKKFHSGQCGQKVDRSWEPSH